jgi:hypothetical protein
MNIAKLANEIGSLRYEAEYRFESGEPFYQTLSKGDLRGVLAALERRGFVIVHDQRAHMESPSIFSDEDQDRETTM